MASSVQRLPNGKWLIVNSYTESGAGGSPGFGGEVFEYDPKEPPTQEVLWCSPGLEWIDPLVGNWKQSSTNTHNLRQPKSAMRQ